jgi:hypothetical protein
MVFSRCCGGNFKAEVQGILPFSISNSVNKYIGLPTQQGSSKIWDFTFIIDKVRKKLKGWKERTLSFSGRRTLINAVAQAIPVYTMSCFLLPKGICDKIEREICQFWWGNKEGQHKIHRISEDKLQRHKY